MPVRTQGAHHIQVNPAQPPKDPKKEPKLALSLHRQQSMLSSDLAFSIPPILILSDAPICQYIFRGSLGVDLLCFVVERESTYRKF
jgi:hypothetical protein